MHENPQLLPSTSTDQKAELIPSSEETFPMTSSDLVVTKPKQRVPELVPSSRETVPLTSSDLVVAKPKPCVPRPLKNLLPFNNPGFKE